MKVDTRTRYIDNQTGRVIGIHTGDNKDFIMDGKDKIIGVKPYTPPQEENLLEIPD